MSVFKKEIDFSRLKNAFSRLREKLKDEYAKFMLARYGVIIYKNNSPVGNGGRPQMELSATSLIDKTVDFPIKNAQSSASHLDQKKTLDSDCGASGHNPNGPIWATGFGVPCSGFVQLNIKRPSRKRRKRSSNL